MTTNLRAALDAMLARLASETLGRAAGAPFARVMDSGRIIGILEPKPQVRMDAAAAYAQCQSWTRSAAALLKRRGATPAARRLLALVADLEPLVRCTRKDDGEMTETQWRKSFADALATRIAQIEALIGEHLRSFDLVRVAPARQAIFDIAITAPEERESAFTQHLALPANEYGRRLYDLATRYMSGSVFEAPPDTNVRYQIWLDAAGALAGAQWERLHDGREFIALRRATSIARAVAVVGTPAAPETTNSLPRRVLVTISTPDEAEPINGGTERAALEATLGPLVVLGFLELQFSPDGTLETLRRLLRAAADCGRPFHTWHYIGHGSYDSRVDSSTLLMETASRKIHRVGGDELGFLLRSYGPLSTVVLNCCHGGHGSPSGANAVPARALAAAGVPAVVAMQSTIRDDAANMFAEELYCALCDGRSIDEAVAEGRRRLFLAPGLARNEWATPALFVAVTPGASTMAPHLYGKPQR